VEGVVIQVAEVLRQEAEELVLEVQETAHQEATTLAVEAVAVVEMPHEQEAMAVLA